MTALHPDRALQLTLRWFADHTSNSWVHNTPTYSSLGKTVPADSHANSASGFSYTPKHSMDSSCMLRTRLKLKSVFRPTEAVLVWNLSTPPGNSLSQRGEGSECFNTKLIESSSEPNGSVMCHYWHRCYHTTACRQWPWLVQGTVEAWRFGGFPHLFCHQASKS